MVEGWQHKGFRCGGSSRALQRLCRFYADIVFVCHDQTSLVHGLNWTTLSVSFLRKTLSIYMCS